MIHPGTRSASMLLALPGGTAVAPGPSAAVVPRPGVPGCKAGPVPRWGHGAGTGIPP